MAFTPKHNSVIQSVKTGKKYWLIYDRINNDYIKYRIYADKFIQKQTAGAFLVDDSILRHHEWFESIEFEIVQDNWVPERYISTREIKQYLTDDEIDKVNKMWLKWNGE